MAENTHSMKYGVDCDSWPKLSFSLCFHLSIEKYNAPFHSICMNDIIMFSPLLSHFFKIKIIIDAKIQQQPKRVFRFSNIDSKWNFTCKTAFNLLFKLYSNCCLNTSQYSFWMESFPIYTRTYTTHRRMQWAREKAVLSKHYQRLNMIVFNDFKLK